MAACAQRNVAYREARCTAKAFVAQHNTRAAQRSRYSSAKRCNGARCTVPCVAVPRTVRGGSGEWAGSGEEVRVGGGGLPRPRRRSGVALLV